MALIICFWYWCAFTDAIGGALESMATAELFCIHAALFVVDIIPCVSTGQALFLTVRFAIAAIIAHLD